MTRLLVSAAIAALSLAAAPAFAQDGGLTDPGGDKVNQLIIYGDDPCPTSASGEITVCARKPEEERYRIPEALRDIDRAPDAGWAGKVRDYEADAATGGCSAAGLNGSQGCWRQFLERGIRGRANAGDGRYAKAIQAEREKRLARIDADAKAEQLRVEEAERAWLEHQERQAAGGVVQAAEPAADATAQD